MSKPDPAAVFAALGDPTRLDLLDRLTTGRDMPLGRLVAGTGMTRQGATRHLRILEAAGLVQCRIAGRERLFRAAPGGIEPALSRLEHLARGWEDALGRLRDHVEKRGP